jgi:predicted extracellular nuclease
LARGDFGAAYAFETPAYRESVTEAQYRAQFGSAARWQSAESRSVELDEDRAKVGLIVRYQTVAPAGGAVIPGERFMTERWIKVNEDWWYVRN